MDIYRNSPIGELLAANSYPGRGIVIGKSADGKSAVTAYFIMGRSANSRNRVFVENPGKSEVIIHPFDSSKVEDPSLIIYYPIRKIGNELIVTNGDQTDTIYEFLKAGKTFEEALETRQFEPDGPNWTPRISGILTFGRKDFNYKMSILKSADAEGSACNRYTYHYAAVSGVGHFIHTYLCDGNPIPTFQGEPERVYVPNDIDEFTNAIWSNLNEANKISLYVRYVDLETGKETNRMINKNK
ncbi:MAG: IMP cyclohydrolase [Eubacteriales bacterium]